MVLAAGKVTRAMPWTRPAALMVAISARLALASRGGAPDGVGMVHHYHAPPGGAQLPGTADRPASATSMSWL